MKCEVETKVYPEGVDGGVLAQVYLHWRQYKLNP